MSDIQSGTGEDTFDLAAAGLRGDGAELVTSEEVLAAKLEQALPGQARVERSGGGLLGRGRKRVRAVRVSRHGRLPAARGGRAQRARAPPESKGGDNKGPGLR